MGFLDSLFGGKQKSKVVLPLAAEYAFGRGFPIAEDIFREERDLLGRGLPFVNSPFAPGREAFTQPLVSGRQAAQGAVQHAGGVQGMPQEDIGALMQDLEGLDPELIRQLMALFGQRAASAQGTVRPGTQQAFAPSTSTQATQNPFNVAMQLGGTALGIAGLFG